MKPFCTKFFAAFLFLGCAFNAKAVNDTLTIGQAFDWKVGDSLVYHLYTWEFMPGFPCSPCGTSSSELAFSIQSRQNFPDTTFYNIRWSDGIIDTLFFSSLDTLTTKFSYTHLYEHFDFCPELKQIPNCESNPEPCNVNQSTTPPINSLTSTSIYYSNFEVSWDVSFTQKIGLRYIKFNKAEFPFYPGGCAAELISYKSDSITWVDSSYYFYNSISDPTPSPSFSLFPNPATDELTITTQGGNSSPFDINIYDIMGNCVLTHKNISQNMAYFKVSHLPPGYYLLKLTDGHSNSSSKGFIIAR